MTAPPQMNGAPPPPQTLPNGTVPVDPAMVTNALLNAIQRAAENAASSHSAAEAKDFLNGALLGAQAVVVLDPSLSQGGTPLQHDLTIEALRGQTQENLTRIQGQTQLMQEKMRGEHAVRQAKETAKAPTPSKTKIATVRRDEHGRMSSASVTEH